MQRYSFRFLVASFTFTFGIAILMRRALENGEELFVVAEDAS